MTAWEERMSRAHRPTYPSDPVPDRKPFPLSRWYTPSVRWKIGPFLIPKPPRLLCRKCFTWQGRWVLDRNEWVPQYDWVMTCKPLSKGCPHKHHNNDVFLA